MGHFATRPEEEDHGGRAREDAAGAAAGHSRQRAEAIGVAVVVSAVVDGVLVAFGLALVFRGVLQTPGVDQVV